MSNCWWVHCRQSALGLTKQQGDISPMGKNYTAVIVLLMEEGTSLKVTLLILRCEVRIRLQHFRGFQISSRKIWLKRIDMWGRAFLPKSKKQHLGWHLQEGKVALFLESLFCCRRTEVTIMCTNKGKAIKLQTFHCLVKNSLKIIHRNANQEHGISFQTGWKAECNCGPNSHCLHPRVPAARLWPAGPKQGRNRAAHQGCSHLHLPQRALSCAPRPGPDSLLGWPACSCLAA